jgi:hypothetical protein
MWNKFDEFKIYVSRVEMRIDQRDHNVANS